MNAAQHPSPLLANNIEMDEEMKTSTPEIEAQNRRVIEAMVEAFRTHDLPAMTRWFAEDGVYKDAIGGGKEGKTYRGKEAIHSVFARQLKLLPTHTFEDAIILVEGNKAHANWTLVMGRNQEYRVRGCDYFELEDGRITLKTAWLKNHIELSVMIVWLRVKELFTKA